MLKISKVTLNNYWSYERAELAYDFNGPVLILGERNDVCFSSNGAGKSSLFEAVMWCLFAKTTKGLLANTVVNYKNKKDCFVKVEGSINNIPFTVTRYRQHSTHKNDVHFTYNNHDSRGGTNQETNIKIEKTLNLDFEFFKQTCFFNPRTVQGFCSLSDSNKKSILEYILNLNKWEDYYSQVTEELNESIKAKEFTGIKLQEKIQDKNRFVTNVLKPFLGSNENINAIKSKIIEIKDKLKIELIAVDPPSHDPSMLTNQANVLKNRIINKNTCITCGNPVVQNIEDLKTQLRDTMAKLQEYKQQKTIYDNYRRQLGDRKRLEHEHTALVSQLAVAQKRADGIANLKKQLESYDVVINKYKKLLKANNKNIQEYTILKKAFSPKGIKSYIIKDILPYLNKRLEHYSSELTNDDIKVNITFDYDSNRLISSINKDVPYDYANLSSGEAKRVDLCMLFSLLDLMSTLKNRPNFIILDEIFDSLDEKGLDKVVNLLYNINYENIFVITHNNDLKEYFTNKILIKNMNGISTIANSNQECTTNP